jgi:hypothetical protein
MAIQAAMKSPAWAGVQAADRRAAGRHECRDPWPRRGPPEGGPWPCCRAGRSPLETGAQADHHQEAVATVRTALTSLEGERGGVVQRALLERRRSGCERCVPHQPPLEWMPEGTVDGTPQPIGPDGVAPLGPHRRPNAADARQRGQGHGLPAMVLGILRAAADLAIHDGEQTAMGQRDPVDRAAQVAASLVGPWPGRLTVHDPRPRPDRLREGELGSFLAHPIPAEASAER